MKGEVTHNFTIGVWVHRDRNAIEFRKRESIESTEN
jgi:hypothetical protein